MLGVGVLPWEGGKGRLASQLELPSCSSRAHSSTLAAPPSSHSALSFPLPPFLLLLLPLASPRMSLLSLQAGPPHPLPFPFPVTEAVVGSWRNWAGLKGGPAAFQGGIETVELGVRGGSRGGGG